jgi:hypothetical protein
MKGRKMTSGKGNSKPKKDAKKPKGRPSKKDEK